MWGRIWEKIGSLIGSRKTEMLSSQFGELKLKAEALVERYLFQQDGMSQRLCNKLRHDFKFADAYNHQNLNNALVHAINYQLEYYQLAAFALRHSKDFKETKGELTVIINKIIMQDLAEEELGTQLEEIINGMRIPSSEEFINNQMKVLQRLFYFINLEV